MNGMYLMRMGCVIAVAVIASTVTAGLLMLLPAACAIATLFTGLGLFLIGAKLHQKWPVVFGGVLMFGGIFAAAIIGS